MLRKIYSSIDLASVGHHRSKSKSDRKIPHSGDQIHNEVMPSQISNHVRAPQHCSEGMNATLDVRKGSDSSKPLTPVTSESSCHSEDDIHSTPVAIRRGSRMPVLAIPEEHVPPYRPAPPVREVSRHLHVVNPDLDPRDVIDNSAPKRLSSQRSEFSFSRRALNFQDVNSYDYSRLRHDIDKMEHLILELREVAMSRKNYDELLAGLHGQLERHQLAEDKLQFDKARAELKLDKLASQYEMHFQETQRDLKMKTKTIDSLHDEMISLRTSWQRHLEEKTKLRRERRGLLKESAALEAALATSKVQIDALILSQDTEQHFEEDLADTTDEKKKSRTENALTHLPRELSRLQLELERAQQDLTKAREELNDSQASIKVLESHCQNMHIEHGVPMPLLERKPSQGSIHSKVTDSSEDSSLQSVEKAELVTLKRLQSRRISLLNSEIRSDTSPTSFEDAKAHIEANPRPATSPRPITASIELCTRPPASPLENPTKFPEFDPNALPNP